MFSWERERPSDFFSRWDLEECAMEEGIEDLRKSGDGGAVGWGRWMDGWRQIWEDPDGMMVFMFHLRVAAVLSMQRLSDGPTKTPLLPLPLRLYTGTYLLKQTNKLTFWCTFNYPPDSTVHTLLHVSFLSSFASYMFSWARLCLTFIFFICIVWVYFFF